MRQPQVVLPSQSQTTMKMRSSRDKTRQINASQVHQPFGKRAKPTRHQPTNTADNSQIIRIRVPSNWIQLVHYTKKTAHIKITQSIEMMGF